MPTVAGQETSVLVWTDQAEAVLDEAPTQLNLIDLLIRELGPRNMQAFFCHPESERILQHFLEAAIRWVAERCRIEIVDADTYEIDANGRFLLDQGADKRVLKIVRVRQGGATYYEAKTTYPDGYPMLSGSWYVYKREFLAMGEAFFRTNPFWNQSSWQSFQFLVPAVLQSGPVEITYWGVPTEDQLGTNEILRSAVIHYAMFKAYQFIVPKVLRPARVRVTGVPDVIENSESYREAADARLKAAEEEIMDKTILLGG